MYLCVAIFPSSSSTKSQSKTKAVSWGRVVIALQIYLKVYLNEKWDTVEAPDDCAVVCFAGQDMKSAYCSLHDFFHPHAIHIHPLVLTTRRTLLQEQSFNNCVIQFIFFQTFEARLVICTGLLLIYNHQFYHEIRGFHYLFLSFILCLHIINVTSC